MVFSLLIGMALAKGIAEAGHVAKGGMSFKGEEEFDKEVGYQGIDPTDVVRIAQRHGIYPNKKGVLPYVEPPQRVINYVKRYSDSSTTVDEFKRNWSKTVEKQIHARQEYVKNNSSDAKQYDKNFQHRRNNVVPNLNSNKTKIFTVEHWMGMPESEHKRRVNQMVHNTILGEYLAGAPVLRESEWTMGGHIEFYKVKLDADGRMDRVEFLRLYRQCCAKCGFDY